MREGIFRIVLLDREVIFQLSSNGLYYFDAAERDNIVLLVNTVSEKRDGFTRREYKGDREARRVLHLLRFPHC